jgi:hypothetical protein
MKANLTALTKIAMALLFLGVAFAQGGAVAQESSDMGKVKAASQAFYAALNARDPSAMARWLLVRASPSIVRAWTGSPFLTNLIVRRDHYFACSRRYLLLFVWFAGRGWSGAVSGPQKSMGFGTAEVVTKFYGISMKLNPSPDAN